MSMYINVKRLTQFSLTDNLLKFNIINHMNIYRTLWVLRHPHDNVESSVTVGLVGVRNRGRQQMCWLDNIW